MVQPRNASTVVLLRPAAGGKFEILLTRRPPQMRFLGGYYVFPGDHWVTPEIYSMRFDTRFYIAKLPQNQTPLTCSEEVTDSLWVAPQDALSRIHRRDFPLLPPTTTVLAELAEIESWDALRSKYPLPQ